MQKLSSLGKVLMESLCGCECALILFELCVRFSVSNISHIIS